MNRRKRRTTTSRGKEGRKGANRRHTERRNRTVFLCSFLSLFSRFFCLFFFSLFLFPACLLFPLSLGCHPLFLRSSRDPTPKTPTPGPSPRREAGRGNRPGEKGWTTSFRREDGGSKPPPEKDGSRREPPTNREEEGGGASHWRTDATPEVELVADVGCIPIRKQIQTTARGW